MSIVAGVAVFFFGAIVGALLDHLHVSGGVLNYPHVFFWGQAWWVTALFGTATLSLLLPWRISFRGKQRRWPSAWPAAAYLLLFAVAYATSVVLQHQPKLALAVFVLLWLPFAVRLGRRVVTYCLLTAVGGVLTEAYLVHIGAFRYLAPGQMGIMAVPIWLPGLYLWACLAVRGIDLAFFEPLGVR